MELEQVKDNTWVLKSWELIPVYRLDAHKCILLDTGLVEQREELQEALTNYGLEPVGVICSHAHIDHMGNVAYLKEKYGAKLAMSLGEAGHQMSYLGLNVTSYLLPPEDLESWDAVKGTPCLAASFCPPRIISRSAARSLTSSTPPATRSITSAPGRRTTCST